MSTKLPELQEMANQVDQQSAVVSVEAKPRLRWTPQLHGRFVDAVSLLGGAEKATPKAVMRVMGVSGLTLYHLKSHLQKFRMAKSQHMNANVNIPHNDEEGQNCVLVDLRKSDTDTACSEIDQRKSDIGTACSEIDQTKTPLNVPMLQMQIEVQRKLEEHIKVQEHLQLRIEAQGKYLQSVLRKAQETIAGYSSSSADVEVGKAGEKSEMVSVMNIESMSSTINIGSFTAKRAQQDDSSTDSCLTSTERQEVENVKRVKLGSGSSYIWGEESNVDDVINSNRSNAIQLEDIDQVGEKKRLRIEMGYGFEQRQQLDLNR